MGVAQRATCVRARSTAATNLDVECSLTELGLGTRGARDRDLRHAIRSESERGAPTGKRGRPVHERVRDTGRALGAAPHHERDAHKRRHERSAAFVAEGRHDLESLCAHGTDAQHPPAVGHNGRDGSGVGPVEELREAAGGDDDERAQTRDDSADKRADATCNLCRDDRRGPWKACAEGSGAIIRERSLPGSARVALGPGGLSQASAQIGGGPGGGSGAWRKPHTRSGGPLHVALFVDALDERRVPCRTPAEELGHADTNELGRRNIRIVRRTWSVRRGGGAEGGGLSEVMRKHVGRVIRAWRESSPGKPCAATLAWKVSHWCSGWRAWTSTCSPASVRIRPAGNERRLKR